MRPPCHDGALRRATEIAATQVAAYDAVRRRVEMHRVSRRGQRVHVPGRGFEFAAGESIRTENSYPHRPLGLQAPARRAGGLQRQPRSDLQSRCAVRVFERPAAAGSAA